MDNRYQFQPGYIKVYRWLRWRPYWALKATWVILRWLASGARVHEDGFPCERSRRWYAKFLWTIHRSLAECSMRHVWTMEEVMHREAPTPRDTSTPAHHE
jgi:hypothetical protein